MRLRFARTVTECADPEAVLKAADETCRWSGFRSGVGMRAYVDDDGDSVACSVSFAARHAGMLDSARHMLIWVPEMTQSDIADIARLYSFVRHVYIHPNATGDPKTEIPKQIEANRLRDAVGHAYSSLKGRGDVVERMLGDSGLAMADLLDRIPIDERDRVIDGLRVLPLGFSVAEIESWREIGGPMTGIGVQQAYESWWFSGPPAGGEESREWVAGKKNNPGNQADKTSGGSEASVQPQESSSANAEQAKGTQGGELDALARKKDADRRFLQVMELFRPDANKGGGPALSDKEKMDEFLRLLNEGKVEVGGKIEGEEEAR